MPWRARLDVPVSPPEKTHRGGHAFPSPTPDLERAAPMHPAYSVILFTTASGAGLGLLAWLALLALVGALPAERWLGFTGLASSFVLVAGGLLSSTMHLGRPERAWRALSQWRTSWLSREGVMVIATAGLALVLAFGWILLERVDGVFAVAAALVVGCAIVTLSAAGVVLGA